MHRVLSRIIFGQTKINHFDAGHVIFLVKHEVLRFDIPMGNSFGVKIIQSSEQLLHDVRCHVFAKIFLFDDVVEEFSTLAISNWSKHKVEETN